MVPETFPVIYGQVAFNTAQRRNTAQAQLISFLEGQSQLRRQEPTINVTEGKYGGGPGLGVTVYPATIVDGDALWSDLRSQAFGFIVDGGAFLYNVITMDAEEGTSSFAGRARRSFPAHPADFDDVP